MGKYIIRRLIIAVPVILGVVTITFAVMYLLPGDPAAIMLAKSGASAEQVARLRAELGFDDPLHIQYFRYLSNAIRGDFGKSIWSQEPVVSIVMTRLPKTMELALAAMLVSLPIGCVFGVLAAVYQDTWLDRLLVAISSIGVAMPSFWSGLMLILLFSVTLKWLPASGQGELKHLILPGIVLGFGSMGTTTRTARSSMVEILREDYLRTARAKGISERAVVLRHGFRNALIPIVTMLGLQFGWLVSNSFIVEMVFARQGMGTVLVTAIQQKDLPIVQGMVLFTAGFYILLNIGVDLTYALVDPRIRYS